MTRIFNNIFAFVKEYKIVFTFLSSVTISLIGGYYAFNIDGRKLDNESQRIRLNRATLKDATCKELLIQIYSKYEEAMDKIDVLTKELEELKIQGALTSQQAILFSNSLDNMPIPFWVTSTDGKIIKLNRSCEAMFLIPNGFTRNEVMNKNFDYIWEKETVKDIKKNNLYVISNNTVIYVSQSFILNDTVARIKVYKFPISVNGIAIGVGNFVIPKI